MGGRTSLVVAGRVPERVAAAMSFHGGGLVDRRRRAARTCWPTRCRPRCTWRRRERRVVHRRAGETLDKALTAAGVEHTIEFYSAAHGFAVPDNEPYDPAAAQRHWEAMERVFGATLK